MIPTLRPGLSEVHGEFKLDGGGVISQFSSFTMKDATFVVTHGVVLDEVAILGVYQLRDKCMYEVEIGELPECTPIQGDASWDRDDISSKIKLSMAKIGKLPSADKAHTITYSMTKLKRVTKPSSTTRSSARVVSRRARIPSSPAQSC